VEGRAPTITRVSRLEDEAQAKCDAIVRAPGDGITDLTNGRLYVPQTRAREYEDRLRDPKLRGIMRVRIRDDGVMTPKALRFRPLTAAEIKARQARETDRPPAPLIMDR
jgi:hypothetical protein